MAILQGAEAAAPVKAPWVTAQPFGPRGPGNLFGDLPKGAPALGSAAPPPPQPEAGRGALGPCPAVRVASSRSWGRDS